MRSVALFAALGFIALLTFLTVSVWLREGFDILVGASLLILGMFLFGIVGALLNPPED